jgi:glycosyltransferase involved in cell wall biosynthesis
MLAMRYETPFHANWVSDAVEKAKAMHAERNFDLVYTRSIPIAAHIAGYWCAQAFHLPWIANINDPWASEFFPIEDSPKLSAFSKAANIFWLRRTLARADVVTYPCRRLKDFHSKLANSKRAAEVIPHIGSKPKDGMAPAAGDFRLVHAGKLLAADGRFGKTLLSGLKLFFESFPEAAAHTSLLLVGPSDDDMRRMIGEMGLQQNVDFVGRVNYEQSLTYMASASVCVLIEARMEEGIFFASKLADYLAQGKPVLAVSPVCGTAADLADRGELLRVDQTPEAVKDGIAKLYGEFKTGSLRSRNPSEQLQSQLQDTKVAENFLGMCRTLLAARTEGRNRRIEIVKQHGALFDEAS